MRIAHNMAAQFTDLQLGIVSGKKAKASERLGSGYKINRSADNAAGLQISEKMRSQIRGLEQASVNSQDGISLIQVADGALDEVHAMLQRMNELVVQAANDTYTNVDRQAIEEEINQLKLEIDRIGTDTEFNTRKIFTGAWLQALDVDGNEVEISTLPFTDFRLDEFQLSGTPFDGSSDANTLNLEVTVKDVPVANWDLIYGDGDTSHSTLRVSYTDDQGKQIKKDIRTSEMRIQDISVTNDGKNCGRTFLYDFGDGVSFSLKQTISVTENNGNEQFYKMDWVIKNTGTRDATAEFMFSADTAYNDNDACESYFVAGKKIDKFCLYTSDPDYTNQGLPYVYDMSKISGNSFTIIDEEHALPFTEKIEWSGANGPDVVSIGRWDRRIWGTWEYFDSLQGNIGGSTNEADIGFNLIWKEDLTKGAEMKAQFKQGIANVKTDSNIGGVDITMDTGNRIHKNKQELWIQSGASSFQGMFVTIDEMNSVEIGIKNVSAVNREVADQSITLVHKAIEKLSAQRSRLGAQQNRLAHSMLNADNMAENMQAAESRIRDANIAEEMVRYSGHSILEQAGQSMLAQANQSTQGILQLLQ